MVDSACEHYSKEGNPKAYAEDTLRSMILSSRVFASLVLSSILETASVHLRCQYVTKGCKHVPISNCLLILYIALHKERILFPSKISMKWFYGGSVVFHARLEIRVRNRNHLKVKYFTVKGVQGMHL